MDNYAVKLFESLQKLKVTDENKAEVEKIKQDIRKKDFKKALDRIEKIKNSNVEKKNKELYKNAADVPDDDFFTNDEVKEEANTESQKEIIKKTGIIMMKIMTTIMVMIMMIMTNFRKILYLRN